MTKQTASRLWAAWTVAGCALEGWAFAKGEPGSTLSANVTEMFHIPRRAPFSEKLRRAITIGFIVWLPIHWATGGKI